MLGHITSDILAFAATIVVILILTPLAKRVHLIDHPGGRKAHGESVPLTGGIAMFIGLLIGVMTQATLLSPLTMMTFIAGCAFMLAMGIADDVVNLSPHLRLAAQTLGALLLMSFADMKLVHFGDLFFTGDITLGIWSVPVTLFAIVGVMNALNMSDGMDGLAGGIVLVTLASLEVLAFTTPHHNGIHMTGILITIVAAFLCFNLRTPWRHRARIFMGDGGSMFLGLTVGFLLVDFSQPHGTYQPIMSPVTALWIFALPLLDTVSVMLRRILKGRSPFAADREHFHHILLLAGYTPGRAVAMMLILATILAGIGIAGHLAGAPEGLMFGLFLALFGFYFWGMQHAWKVMRAIRVYPASKVVDEPTRPQIF